MFGDTGLDVFCLGVCFITGNTLFLDTNHITQKFFSTLCRDLHFKCLSCCNVDLEGYDFA